MPDAMEVQAREREDDNARDEDRADQQPGMPPAGAQLPPRWAVRYARAPHSRWAYQSRARGGTGLLVELAPSERHEVIALETARVLLLLTPWPGPGHPGAMTITQKLYARRHAAKIAGAAQDAATDSRAAKPEG